MEIPWQKELSEILGAGQSTVVLLHGAIRDQIILPGKNYGSLGRYLYEEVFADKDFFIQYDPSSGIDFPNKDKKREFLRTLEAYDSYHGTNFGKSVPREPGQAFLILENFLKLKAHDNKSAVLVIDYLEDILPASDRSFLSSEARYCLVTLDKWSRDSFFLNNDITIILNIENLAFLESKLVRNIFIPRIEIILPNEKHRLKYINYLTNKDQAYKNILKVEEETAAALSSGLSLIQLKRLWAHAKKNNKEITLDYLKQKKKEVIESDCAGLLEFLEPKSNLDLVAGHKYAKQKLKQAAFALAQAKTDVLPMGYLVCGPVGTGKSFLVNCFAGEIGIPVVRFLNFRSQWVGATEANLQKIINILKALWPIAVVIDEADAFLGNREASGDSGTSGRVFASIISFMGDTKWRGKIVWFLITSRPDILPIDVKRQGRAEEHLALFYPHSQEDKDALFKAISGKLGIDISSIGTYNDFFPEESIFSGADMEAALTRARFLSFTKGEKTLQAETLREAIEDFNPPSYPEQIEMQNLIAVRECTSKKLLPDKYKKMSASEVNKRIKQLELI